MRSCLFGVVLSLALSALPAADFKIGPDVPLDSLAICAGTSSYMVCYRDITNGDVPLWRACTLSQTGVSGVPFTVHESAGRPLSNSNQIASIAYDGTHFLLVWADNRAGAPGVYARRVTVGGALLTGEFLVAPIARNFDVSPQVAFTGSDFVVAWQDNAASSTANATQVKYARLAFSGAAGPVRSAALSATTSSQRLFAVTGGTTGEALITFQDSGVSPANTRGIRYGAADTVLTPEAGLLLTEQSFEAFGFGAPLGVYFANNEYTVLTSFGTQMDSSIFRVRVLNDNRVIRSSNPLGDVPQGNTDLDENNFPRSFYNGNNEIFFVRNIQANAGTYHITTKRVTTEGKDRDPNMLVVDDAPSGVLNGGVAANIGAQYLVAWMDGRRIAAPARQTNIYGVFIDGEAKADEGQGFVRAVARVSPAIGAEAPFKTQFGAGGSTGTLDSAEWNFGDGETDDILSPVHEYAEAGDYIAILSLFRRGLVYRDFVRVFVASKAKGALGGPAQAITGAPLEPSASVDTDMYFTVLSATLSFSNPASDTLRLSGFLNPAQIPFTQTDVPVSVTIGNRTSTFTLNSAGSFVPEVGATPAFRYSMNRFTGSFTITTSRDSLLDVLGPFGVTNGTVAKPGVELTIPVSLTYNDITRTETITAVYTASAGKSGTLSYMIGNKGFSSGGRYRVLSVVAKERGKVDNRTHQFGFTGVMGFGGRTALTKAASGVWRFTLGNYSEEIPVEKLTDSNNSYTYKAPKGTKGISSLTYFRESGGFRLFFNDLAAEGLSPSGMPVATSPVLRSDMVLNVELDVEGGRFQAGGYARFIRTKVGSKKWVLR